MQSHFALPTPELQNRRERAVASMRLDKVPAEVGEAFRKALLDLLQEYHRLHLSVPVDAEDAQRLALFHVTNHAPVARVFRTFYGAIHRYILEKIRATTRSLRAAGEQDPMRIMQKANVFLEGDLHMLRPLSKSDPVVDRILALSLTCRTLLYYTLQFCAYANINHPSTYMLLQEGQFPIDDNFHAFLAYFWNKQEVMPLLHRGLGKKVREDMEGYSFFHDWCRTKAFVHLFYGKSPEERDALLVALQRDFAPMEQGMASRERFMTFEADLVAKLTPKQAGYFLATTEDTLAERMRDLTGSIPLLRQLVMLSKDNIRTLESYLPPCRIRHFTFQLLPGAGMTEGVLRFSVLDRRDKAVYLQTLELALNPPALRIEEYPYMDLDEQADMVGLGRPFGALALLLMDRAEELLEAFVELFPEQAQHVSQAEAEEAVLRDPLAKWLEGIHTKYHGQLRKAMEDVLANNLGAYKLVDIRGERHHRRIRVGEYRIVFERRGNQNHLVEVGTRQDVYRRWGG